MKYLLAVLLFTSVLGVRPAHAEIQAWQVITLMTRLDEKASGPAGWIDEHVVAMCAAGRVGVTSRE